MKNDRYNFYKLVGFNRAGFFLSRFFNFDYIEFSNPDNKMVDRIMKVMCSHKKKTKPEKMETLFRDLIWVQRCKRCNLWLELSKGQFPLVRGIELKPDSRKGLSKWYK